MPSLAPKARGSEDRASQRDTLTQPVHLMTGEKKVTYSCSSRRFLSSSASFSAFSLACLRFSASLALYSSALMSPVDFSMAEGAGRDGGGGGAPLPPSSSAPGVGDRTRTGVRDAGVEGVAFPGAEGAAAPAEVAPCDGCCDFADDSFGVLSLTAGFC